MGRSVSYLNNAEVIIYFPTPEYQQVGEEYDEYLGQLAWDDLILNLTYEIKAKLPSYQIEKGKWDGRETKIILSNSLCNIGISEYCGLVSLSVAPIDRNYCTEYQYRENFAVHHAKQIEKTLQSIVDGLTGSRLVRQGTFSNGTGVFALANNTEGVYENAERIL